MRTAAASEPILDHSAHASSLRTHRLSYTLDFKLHNIIRNGYLVQGKSSCKSDAIDEGVKYHLHHLNDAV